MKKALSLLLTFVLLAALLASCGGNGQTSATPTPSKAPVASSTPTPTETKPEEPGFERNAVVLPLTSERESFTMWTGNGTTFDGFADYYDNEVYKEMEVRTGVHMDFIHPVLGSEQESFMLLITAEDYPDLWHNIYTRYTWGMDKAIDEGILIRLNEYAETVMPNYYYHITRLPEIWQQAVTDTGNLWGVHHLVDRPQGAWAGLGIRQDWLDTLGMKMPETMDELEAVLTGFKGLTSVDLGPLWLPGSGMAYGSSLNGSYNVVSTAVNNGYINKDGVATYSPLEDGFKEYLMKMNDWYAKGLVYRDFQGIDVFPKANIVTDEKCGVFEFVYTFSGMWKEAMTDPNVRILPMTTPKVNASDSYSDIHIRQQQFYIRAGNSAGITTACKNPELLCKYFDYLFSDDGIILGNYGIEGVSYYMGSDGKPHYTDEVMALCLNNITYVQTKYAVHNHPTYSIWSRELEALTADQASSEEVWGKAGSDWIMPEITLTSDEGDEFRLITSDITTLVSENVVQFITGTKSFNDYDAFIAQIKSMNIDRATELQQIALDRYLNRE